MDYIKNKLKELWHYLKAEFIIEQKKRLKIFRYQPRLIIFIAILLYINSNFNFRGFGPGIYLFFQPPIFTLVFLLIAMSNTTERIYRRIEDVRHIATKTEKDYLLPIFDEVYESVKQKHTNLSNKIQLYIIDTMNVESFALGKRTIVLSRGMINTMTSEELKGVLAHEFSHIALYHSQMRMIIAVTMGTTFWIILFIEKLLERIISTMKSDNIIAILLKLINIPFVIVVKIVFFIANIIIIPRYRKSEYKADKMAAECGFGMQIKEALYKIYDMEVSDKMQLMKRFFNDHPRTAYRIENIENLLK